MDQVTFQAADKELDVISDLLGEAIASPQFQKIRDALAALSQVVGDRHTVTLNIVIDVFSEERETALPLLSTGLSASPGVKPYQIWGDCSPQRYLVDGEIQVVPHDRCPKCWQVWDFKWKHRICSHCHSELGKNCKLLLDSDVCPYCEKGRVTRSEPKCPKCGFEVDPTLAAWG